MACRYDIGSSVCASWEIGDNVQSRCVASFLDAGDVDGGNREANLYRVGAHQRLRVVIDDGRSPPS